MEKIEIQYVNEYRKKQGMSGMVFITVVCLGFLSAVGALCGYLWVFR